MRPGINGVEFRQDNMRLSIYWGEGTPHWDDFTSDEREAIRARAETLWNLVSETVTAHEVDDAAHVQ